MDDVLIIAQGSKAGTIDVLFVVAALIVLLVIGGAGVMLYRRRILSDDSGTPQHSSILDELKRAQERGELSVEEYERARRAIVDRARGVEPQRTPAPPDHWDKTAEPGFDLTGEPLPGTPESSDNKRADGE